MSVGVSKPSMKCVKKLRLTAFWKEKAFIGSHDTASEHCTLQETSSRESYCECKVDQVCFQLA